jgi:transposase
MKHYVGLDVSMKSTSICIVDETGNIVYEGTETTDPYKIADLIDKKRFTDCFLGFESGSLTNYLMAGFKERALHAVCMDARKLSAILSMKINKTDKNDARGIAEALRTKMFSVVHCKPMDSVEKDILLTARKSLVHQHVQLKNTVRGLLKAFGIRLGSVSGKNFSEVVKKQCTEIGELCKKGIFPLLEVFDKISEEIKKIDQEVRKLAFEDKEVKRLMTIPGVGPITALTFKNEIFDPSRFKDSKSVGAYLGMTPTQYASGETMRQGRVSKCGPTELRSLLVEAAIVLLTRSQKWSKLKAWGLKIMRKKGLKKAAVAVGRKLAVIMHRMMIQETEFIYGEQKNETQAHNKKESVKAAELLLKK